MLTFSLQGHHSSIRCCCQSSARQKKIILRNNLYVATNCTINYHSVEISVQKSVFAHTFLSDRPVVKVLQQKFISTLQSTHWRKTLICIFCDQSNVLVTHGNLMHRNDFKTTVHLSAIIMPTQFHRRSVLGSRLETITQRLIYVFPYIRTHITLL